MDIIGEDGENTGDGVKDQEDDDKSKQFIIFCHQEIYFKYTIKFIIYYFTSYSNH